MAAGARGSPRRLLALVFAVAATVTAVLSLDATVVLLTPIVFATAARLRTSPRPHVYACSHLANSASLLLPVSNLTNLLAFHASGLSFTALRRAHGAADGGRRRRGVGGADALLRGRPATGRGARGPTAASARRCRASRSPSSALTLAGFGLSSVLGIAPVWVAVAGAAAITVPALARRATTAPDARAGGRALVPGLRPRPRRHRARGQRQRARRRRRAPCCPPASRCPSCWPSPPSAPSSPTSSTTCRRR